MQPKYAKCCLMARLCPDPLQKINPLPQTSKLWPGRGGEKVGGKKGKERKKGREWKKKGAEGQGSCVPTPTEVFKSRHM